MNLKEILSISGTPGLFQYIAQGNGGIIVQAISSDKRRQMVSGSTKVSALGDIAIFSQSDEVPLADIFETIYKTHGGVVAIDSKSTPEQLETFIVSVLPDFDRTRVHNSDIRKLATWYNLLVTAGHTSFKEQEQSAEEAHVPATAAAKKPSTKKSASVAPKSQGSASSKPKMTATKGTTARKSS